MSRPKMPTAVLELKGSYRKNPMRGELRAAEPEADGELRAPERWVVSEMSYDKRYLEIWHETVAICWWLTPAEAGPLESYCMLKDKERRGSAKGPDLTNLFKLYPILGMTQDGRGKFRARGKQDPAKHGSGKGSDWEDMLEESRRIRAV